jgi:hypothetical protein
MGKMFFSLGFWMTILLFMALGYAYQNASGAECAESSNCSYSNVTRASWVSADSKWHFENDLEASDDVRRHRCPSNESPRVDSPDFQQMANLQAGDSPTYAPGFSFTITRRPPDASLCPGPIEIPRH